jgi:hypothetical protein
MPIPEPHSDDFVIDLREIGGEVMMCDRDVQPIRWTVSEILSGAEAPIEWLTLSNADVLAELYRMIRRTVQQRDTRAQEGLEIPVKLREKLRILRWKLVFRVVEAIYGDRKYRAAALHQMPVDELIKMAQDNDVQGRSKMRKRDLVYALAYAARDSSWSSFSCA